MATAHPPPVPAWLAERCRPPSDATIQLSELELAVLARRAGLALPPLLRFDPLPQFDDRDEVVAEITRNLIRRSILMGNREGLQIDPPVAGLLGLLASPVLVSRVEVTRDGLTVEWQYACSADAAIEIAELTDRVWQFSAFGPGELLQRMLSQADVHERRQIRTAPVTISAATIVDLATSWSQQSTQTLAETFIAHGAERPAASAAADALTHWAGSSSVTILHRPGPAQIAGGQLAWLDAGDYGFWLIPTSEELDADAAQDLETRLLELAPTSATFIEAELRGFLPI